MPNGRNIPEITIDFCANCGILLPPGLGNEKSPSCPNCAESVADKESRVEGTFTRLEANKLLRAYDEPEIQI